MSHSGEQSTDQDSALVRLLGRTLRPHRGPLALALLLLIGSATLNLVPPYILGLAIDGPIAAGDVSGLWPLAALYGAAVVGFFLLQYGQTYFLQQAGQRSLADLRTRLFRHILGQDQAFFGRYPTGELVTRLSGDVDALNQLLSASVVTILTESMTLIVVIVVMFAVNWRLALLALAVLPILLFVTRYFRRRIRRSSSNERTALARISGYLNEHLHGMLLVQLFGRQVKSAALYAELNHGYRQALLLLRRNSALFLAVQEVLAAIGLALLLYGGGSGVLSGWATLGMLVTFIQYAERAFQPILRLSEEYNSVQIGLGAAERVQRMLVQQSAIVNPAEPQQPPPLRGAVSFRNVWFSYDPAAADTSSPNGNGHNEPSAFSPQPSNVEWVLRGIDLEVPAGQTVAVVGATGAGKSSLVSLLARLYDPQRGEVLLDGVPIRELALSDLRRSVAVVPQDPVCFAGSIAMNIRLYREDVSDETVRWAAEQSNAAQFIERLPEGYNFPVASGGANLSVGQRQLLALARALALSPQGVLVLDEATSSIDTATEQLIQEALSRILHTRTSIVIAHRLSTIRDADRILVMERGRVIEDGDHSKLLSQGGVYARLHHSHAGEQARGD